MKRNDFLRIADFSNLAPLRGQRFVQYLIFNFQFDKKRNNFLRHDSGFFSNLAPSEE